MTAGERTKLSILEMGVRLWRVDPAYVTARRIARELDIVHGTIGHHFRRGERSLRDAIAYHSVEQGESKVIAQLILEKHKAVANMSEEEKQKHMLIAVHG